MGTEYKPGDVVNGYILTEHDGWQALDGACYEQGNVKNGYILTEHDGWQPALPPRPKSRMSAWKIVGLAFLVLFVGTILVDAFSTARNLPNSNLACEGVSATVEDRMADRQQALARVSAATDADAAIAAARQADTSMLLALQRVVDNPQCFNADDVADARAGIPVVQARLNRY